MPIFSIQDNEYTLTGDLEHLPNMIADLKESSSSPSLLPEDKRDYIETWQIPLISSRTRINTQSSIPSSASFHSSSASLNSQDTSITPPSQTPTHSSPLPPPVPAQPPPPSVQPPMAPSTHPPPAPPTQSPFLLSSANPANGLPANQISRHGPMASHEDMYDVPVVSANVSVSPSQISLVSNSSHQSADSTHSSTRSASPPCAHSTQYYYQSDQTPPTNSAHPHPLTMQQEIMNRSKRRLSDDVPSRPPLVRSHTEITPAQMKYIPATLPRPRKGTGPPTTPKPNGSHARQTENQNNNDILPDADDDNPFARALREKKLKKTVTLDRSAPKFT